jgi:hypothetical protein
MLSPSFEYRNKWKKNEYTIARAILGVKRGQTRASLGNTPYPSCKDLNLRTLVEGSEALLLIRQSFRSGADMSLDTVIWVKGLGLQKPSLFHRETSITYRSCLEESPPKKSHRIVGLCGTWSHVSGTHNNMDC